MNIVEEKYLMKIPRVNDSKEDNFHIWCLRMKAGSRGMKFPFARINDNLEPDVSDKAFS